MEHNHPPDVDWTVHNLYLETTAQLAANGRLVWSLAFVTYIEQHAWNPWIREDVHRIRLQLETGASSCGPGWSLDFAVEVEWNAPHEEIKALARMIRARLETLLVPEEVSV